MELVKGGVMRLAAGAGAVLQVEKGKIWFTQYPDPTDYFLGAGDSMRLDRPGAAVISALSDSQVRAMASPRAKRGWSRVLRVAMLPLPS